MSALLTIARASLTEHFRRKLILFFVLICVVIVAGLAYLTLSRGTNSAIVGALVGLGAAASLGLLPLTITLAAVAVSMNNVGRPFSDGEAMVILARPLARWHYVAGRLLAGAAVIAGLCLFAALLMQTVRALDGGSFDAGLWGHWATTAFNLTILVALVTLFSSLFNAPVLAALTGYFVYASSNLFATLYLAVAAGQLTGTPAAIVSAGYYLTPRTLSSPLGGRGLAPESGIASDVLIPSTGGRVGWAVGYLAVAVALSIVAAGRKDVR
ncbi:MAG: ABC transporter permease [Actinomycetota bacterium]